MTEVINWNSSSNLLASITSGEYRPSIFVSGAEKCEVACYLRTLKEHEPDLLAKAYNRAADYIEHYGDFTPPIVVSIEVKRTWVGRISVDRRVLRALAERFSAELYALALVGRLHFQFVCPPGVEATPEFRTWTLRKLLRRAGFSVRLARKLAERYSSSWHQTSPAFAPTEHLDKFRETVLNPPNNFSANPTAFEKDAIGPAFGLQTDKGIDLERVKHAAQTVATETQKLMEIWEKERASHGSAENEKPPRKPWDAVVGASGRGEWATEASTPFNRESSNTDPNSYWPNVPIIVFPETPCLFVSYARKTKADIEPIVEGLRAMGFAVFFDSDSIHGGEIWLRSLVEAVNTAEAILPFLNEHFFKSDWCTDEILFARQKRKHFFPMLMDDAAMPDEHQFLLQRFQRIDARPNRDCDAILRDFVKAYKKRWKKIPEPQTYSAAPQAEIPRLE